MAAPADEERAQGWRERFARFWRRRREDEAIEEGLVAEPRAEASPGEEAPAEDGARPSLMRRFGRRLRKNAPIFRSSTFIALEVASTIVALLFGVVGLAWWWLAQGPQEVPFFEPYIEAELSQARGGRPVDIDRVELLWTEARGLQLRAVDVKVRDTRGRLLSTSREVSVGISPWHLLIGQVRLTRADFVGGDISVVHKRDGETHIALGPPGSAPDFVVPPPQPSETVAERISRLLDGLAVTLRPVEAGGALSAVSISEARLSIVDEQGGGEWRAESASVELAREGEAMRIAARARLEGPRGPAPASLRITTDTAFSAATIEFTTDDVRPRALFSPAAMGIFAGLDAPLDARVTIGIDRRAGVTQLDGDVTLGRGRADMPGGRFAIEGGRLHGAYDLERDVLTIDQISLAGARNHIDGNIQIAGASAMLQPENEGVANFTASLPSVTLDVPGVFDEGAAMRDVRVAGSFDRAKSEIAFTRIDAGVGRSQLNATGRLYWAAATNGETFPGMTLTGAIQGTPQARDLVELWPRNAAPGARAYLGDALRAADLSDLTFNLDITPNDVARGQLRNEALNIAFGFTNAEFAYVPTMTPVRQGRGRTVIQGNRVDVWFDAGRSEGLTVSGGRVEIDTFAPSGAAVVNVRAQGDVRSMLKLLEQEPLNLRGRLPLQTDTVEGTGAFSLMIRQPLAPGSGPEDIRFTVNGDLQNVGGLERDGRITFAGGALSVRGDQRAVAVSGRVRVGASDATVEWVETLTRGLAAPSRYSISGEFAIEDLQRLGYPLHEIADGRVIVTVRGAGRGYEVDSGNVTLDFRNASVALARGLWSKRSGVQATARFDVGGGEGGVVTLSNIDLRGPGLTAAQGEMTFGADGQLMRAVLPRVQVAERADARIAVERGADGAFVYDVSGAFFDATPWMSDDPAAQAAAPSAAPAEQQRRPPRRQTASERRAAQRAASQQRAATAAAPAEPAPTAQTTAMRAPSAPVRGRVRVERLGLRGSAVLSDARVEFSIANDALVMVSAEGRDPGGGAFALGLGPRPSDPQGRITMRAEDAGFAVRALTGSPNVRGGEATVDGTWTPGAAPRAEFTVRLRDFTAVQMPAMTRLLSAVASLTGMAELLGGEGISFASLDAPVVMQGSRITIGESRASGPSLGLTATGSYDTRADNLDIDGVVVPSYGINSALGNLPVIGQLFVSREGEGVVGITYSMDGPLANARVGVNPLSALAPGILRRIFEPQRD